jgi:phospholipid/cholesterol/gamma-HCH transport system substrate-binding protein
MTNEQKVGLFFIVGIALAVGAIETVVGTGLFSRGYSLFVSYPQVGGLRTGDTVEVAGVKVGRVSAITLQADGVRVKLRLAHEAVVRRDSIARLDYQILSGTRFIAISLGSASQPALQDGDTIDGIVPPSLTQMVDEMQGVARSVERLADSFNTNQQEVLGTVNAMLEENRASLQQALTNIESVTAKLDRGDGTMAKLLNDPALYDRATAVFADLQKVSDRLARGQGDLGRLLNGDGALYDEARETIASLNVVAANLEDVSTRIRNGEGTIGRMVVDDSLYVEAEDTLRGVDRATASIEDVGPISVLGTLVTTLF